MSKGQVSRLVVPKDRGDGTSIIGDSKASNIDSFPNFAALAYQGRQVCRQIP